MATATEIWIRTDQLDSLGDGRTRDVIVVEIHKRVLELSSLVRFTRCCGARTGCA